MNNPAVVLSIALALAISGCDSEVRTQSMIHLPEGDPETGKTEFVALGCINCHVVLNAELPEGEGPLRVMLGSSGRVASYGDLVTSIVNPSHKVSRRKLPDGTLLDGESPMPDYNDVMTVTQLTNLVAFLQQHYQRVERPPFKYRRFESDIQPGADRKREGRREAGEDEDESGADRDE